MQEIIDFLKGRKTYILAIGTLILGALQGFDIFVLPEWVWPIIAACGLASLRAGVNKISDVVKPKDG